jgi:hypothetical protein
LVPSGLSTQTVIVRAESIVSDAVACIGLG